MCHSTKPTYKFLGFTFLGALAATMFCGLSPLIAWGLAAYWLLGMIATHQRAHDRQGRPGSTCIRRSSSGLRR